MTLDDYEIRRTIWDSRIPIEFVLDSSEMMPRSQQSSFVFIQRVSYFPIHLTKAVQHLMGHSNPDLDIQNVWLQASEGRILKWHYPIGVLFDLYNHSELLPWILTIRLKNFPNELIRYTKETFMTCFIQSVKEADQIKHKGNVIYSMSSSEHHCLFDSLCNDKFDDFWSINRKLMASTGDCSNGSLLHIPIRFYDNKSPTFRQTLIASTLSLDDAIKLAYPDALQSIGDIEKLDAISHGIILPLTSSAAWLAQNFSYPDNFVHIVLRPKKIV